MSHRYLDYIREQNKILASKCYYCQKKTAGINAIGAKIVFVCTKHLQPIYKTILDTSQPGVLHYIYPEGKPVDPKMMDPNIGGYHGRKKD